MKAIYDPESELGYTRAHGENGQVSESRGGAPREPRRENRGAVAQSQESGSRATQRQKGRLSWAETLLLTGEPKAY